MSANKKNVRIDLPTLIAVSILAWVLVDVLHEIGGHAGAAVWLGFPVRAVSTTTVYVDVAWPKIIESQGFGPSRFYLAAGTVVNILSGAFALCILRWYTGTRAARYFLWLVATFSAVIVTMNLVSAPLVGVGDWSEFLHGLEPRGRWKAGIIGSGLVLAGVGYALPLHLWMPRLSGRRRVLLTVTVIPVATALLVQTLSLVKSPFAALPPGSNHLLASVFAYIHFVLWAILVNLCPVPRATAEVGTIALPRSRFWLVLGSMALVAFALVLGPGLGSFAGDPRLSQLEANDLQAWDFAAQDLTNANPAPSNLTNPDLTGAGFRNANLDGEGRLSAVVDSTTSYNQWTVFPVGFFPDAVRILLVPSPAGDFDANDMLDSSDLVTAFVDGGYKQGSRTDAAAVPAPTGAMLLIGLALGSLGRRGWRTA